jgi:hypothetical protein
LTITGAPAAPISGGDKTECEESPIQTLTATATVPSGTVVWYDASTGGAVVASPTLSASGTKTYYAEAVLGECKSLTRTPVTLTIYSKPNTSISVTDIRCSGDKPGEINLTVTGGTPTYTFVWTGPDSFTSSNEDLNNLSAAGSYSVEVTDANGCKKNTSAMVNWHDNPTVTIDGPTIPPICGGLESNYLTANATGEEVSYSWAVEGAGWSIDGSNTTRTIKYIAGTSNATFTVIVTDKYECSESAYHYMSPCQGEYHCTYTQGWYGNQGGKNCGFNGTVYISMSAKDMMQRALPYSSDPLQNPSIVFGVSGKSFALYGQDIFNNSIFNMLPAGGKSVSLTGDATYSLKSTWKNVPLSTAKKTEGKILNNLLGQTITLFFNMKNDATLGGLVLKDNYLVTADATNCGLNLASPYTSWYTFIPESVLSYFKSAGLKGTVQDLYALANNGLGGMKKDAKGIILPSLSDIGSAVDAINNGFDECRILVGFFKDYEEASAYLTLAPYSSGTKADEEFTGKESDELSELTSPILKVYPNPFSTIVRFELEMPYEAHVKIEIYSHAGGLIKVILDEDLLQGDVRIAEFDGSLLPHTSYLYKVTAGPAIMSGIIIRSKGR